MEGAKLDNRQITNRAIYSGRRVMVTHQALSGSSDEEFLQRMASTYPERFGEDLWRFFTAQVAPSLPERPVMIDLGCGPGLFLRDLGERYPQATLYGFDVTPAMIAYGKQLLYTGAKPILAVHDVATQTLPNVAGTVHLVSMSSVLHVLDEPLPVLAEIRRVLAPGGLFMLHDWIRHPLQAYLERRVEQMGGSRDEAMRPGFRLFPVHNKYTPEDWQWLLAEAGFTIRSQTQLRPTHQVFVTTPTRTT
jgi:SAM-dependent methyltransferase